MLRAVWVDEEAAPAAATAPPARRHRADLASWVQAGDALWRADTLANQSCGVVASGHALLDAQLPGGGWPLGGLCDILQDPGSHHEWQLLLPALAAAQAESFAHGTTPSWVALIGAPYTPFGPGLAARTLDVTRLLWVQAQTPAERLWAAEQVLRCADVAAVLVWLGLVPTAALRRLQMAAHSQAKLLFALRPVNARHSASPALLRLRVAGPPDDAPDALRIDLLKRRGPPLTDPLVLPRWGFPRALDRVAA
ncbi:MAG: translesion DNA synthesis-associated protein ImuA [Rhodoferax sp.]|nr:translesion DNA synthesis-associated protein ImuA [Rhodoferax sp.]